MCAMLASIDRITRAINRGQSYEDHLLKTVDTLDEPLRDNLCAALVNLYVTVLELLADSAALFGKSTIERMFNATIHPGQSRDLFDTLARMEDDLNREAVTCSISVFVSPLRRLDEGVAALLESVEEDELVGTLEWISSVPFREHHDSVKNSRTADTCRWLLDHDLFRAWEQSSASGILWLQGSRE
jgi:ankyrin repeat domain-containing protein 50